ncbi:MAG: quinolinate synthase NadA [Deltaproteobacteria bacterium]|nr:quinolinate synthase NadA [Deltaproteobacteria bacterium]
MSTLIETAQPLITLALAEDLAGGDATSDPIFKDNQTLSGRIIAKAHGVIAGIEVARAVFAAVDPQLRFEAMVGDGQDVVPTELLATVQGPAASLLAAERTVLNFLGRLSGVATLTRQFVDAVAPSQAEILDTRKTLPGFRALDKYAVRVGGGLNHRQSLSDMGLIKDNHIDGAGGITAAVAAVRSQTPALPLEVEVRDLDELAEALAIAPPLDRILLDNMSLETMTRAVELSGGRVALEASGNVSLESVAAIARTGVDFISVGAITHSAAAFDLSLLVGSGAPKAEGAPGSASLAQRARNVFILGHHYQRNEVLAHCDYRGDSLLMAQQGAKSDADTIVVCGVHFMAEVAKTLARPEQEVLIPEPSAGCYLAETATREDVSKGWRVLHDILGADEAMTPLTYVNSSLALKAFCGEHGGLVCTSSNAQRALAWALERRARAFFFPDQNLGTNAALALGVGADEILRYQPHAPPSAEQLKRARVIVWPGVCHVHQRFRPEHVASVREKHASVRVLVHPECKPEVVALADGSGSTGYLIKEVQQAAAGSALAIGTDARLVKRLQQDHPGLTVVCLDEETPPFCPTMAKITEASLLETLHLAQAGQGEALGLRRMRVDPELARHARIALKRMLEV